jgi:hypothetical protein
MQSTEKELAVCVISFGRYIGGIPTVDDPVELLVDPPRRTTPTPVPPWTGLIGFGCIKTTLLSLICDDQVAMVISTKIESCTNIFAKVRIGFVRFISALRGSIVL